MFNSPVLSLCDLLGGQYVKAVAGAAAAAGASVEDDVFDAVDFYPPEKQIHDDMFIKQVGRRIAPAFEASPGGAATDSFGRAFCAPAAPLTGFGCFRIGEDGHLYLLGKSEHYHTPLGHRFGGYNLIDKARRLGVVNPTHNNTRGYITRLAEIKLIQAANGLCQNDGAALEKILNSREPKTLNRIVNLETGSLAVEAGVKMMLAKFFRLDKSFAEPEYFKKTPVFLVMADHNGAFEANYHGTTVLTQTFRGMWPEFYEKTANAGLYKVAAVKINDIGDFRKKIHEYNKNGFKTAGFLHEIILMNYGAIRLTPEYLNAAYELCRETDTPVLADEIQSCMWYDGMFLFRQYGLNPDFLVIGKGFPGGEYPASKIITTAKMDTLNQFGALVTNGQEELASLSYLITMAFVSANGGVISGLGGYFQNRLSEIGRKYSEIIKKTEGLGHLAALHFHSVKEAAKFAKKLNARYIDASAQIYKQNCPPAVLLKPPVISSEAVMDFIADTIEENI
ncbi:MAG: aminotransferase class III-fold pyridoxal phosphate-dependent enzyme [Oscillospiraceae bacterium]|nr:aminotransferase class III-fold pyridoxal phosphate-dependent enzyme [Oscillospiraceae bacterium]